MKHSCIIHSMNYWWVGCKIWTTSSRYQRVAAAAAVTRLLVSFHPPNTLFGQRCCQRTNGMGQTTPRILYYFLSIYPAGVFLFFFFLSLYFISYPQLSISSCSNLCVYFLSPPKYFIESLRCGLSYFRTHIKLHHCIIN